MNVVGRLKVEEGLSEVRIEAPGEQHLIGVIFWGVYVLLALGGTVPVLSGPIDVTAIATLLGVLAIMGGLAAAVWAVLSRTIRRMQAGSRLAGMALFGSIFLSFTPLLLIGVGSGLAMTAGFSAASAMFYFLILRTLAGPAPAVTIDQSTVVVNHRGSRTSIPLETITDVTPPRPWRSPAMLGEVPVPGLSGMNRAEWAWLSGRILESAQRRRAALAAEGHDLSQSATPPAALEALTQR